jgi:hypothetical protein
MELTGQVELLQQVIFGAQLHMAMAYLLLLLKRSLSASPRLTEL